jgi:glutathione peroxidase-family protein
MESIYDFVVTDIMGLETSLAPYRGKVLLIVNVASKCGFTPQYGGLQAIYDRYKDRGFEILGFPANNFLHQEPGSNSEIREFCTVNYGVSFPMFAKISVRGNDIHPLYRFLTSKETDPNFAGKISWNFNKFLVDRTGNVIGRFPSQEIPESPKIVGAVEKALAGQ